MSKFGTAADGEVVSIDLEGLQDHGMWQCRATAELLGMLISESGCRCRGCGGWLLTGCFTWF